MELMKHHIPGKDIFNIDLDVFCRTAKDKTLECEQLDKFDHISRLTVVSRAAK